MALFFCWFKSEKSWVLSAASREAAIERGTEKAGGVVPSLVVPWRGAVAFEVDEVDTSGDEVEVSLIPDEETADALIALGEGAELGEVDTEAAPADCGSIGYDDDDAAIVCELEAGHDGKHEGGEGLEW